MSHRWHRAAACYARQLTKADAESPIVLLRTFAHLEKPTSSCCYDVKAAGVSRRCALELTSAPPRHHGLPRRWSRRLDSAENRSVRSWANRSSSCSKVCFWRHFLSLTSRSANGGDGGSEAAKQPVMRAMLRSRRGGCSAGGLRASASRRLQRSARPLKLDQRTVKHGAGADRRDSAPW